MKRSTFRLLAIVGLLTLTAISVYLLRGSMSTAQAASDPYVIGAVFDVTGTGVAARHPGARHGEDAGQADQRQRRHQRPSGQAGHLRQRQR